MRLRKRVQLRSETKAGSLWSRRKAGIHAEDCNNARNAAKIIERFAARQETTNKATSMRANQAPSLMPASRTTLPHFSVSPTTKLRNSCGVFSLKSTLSDLNRAMTSG